MRKLFGSNNSYFRIVAHSPNTRKVRPLTDVCNLQDETILDLDDEQPTCVVQPTPLEVVVTENHQNTVIYLNQNLNLINFLKIKHYILL